MALARPSCYLESFDENAEDTFDFSEHLEDCMSQESIVKGYSSEDCCKKSHTKRVLHDHKRTRNESCSKQFTQFSSLQKHERIHRGEKPYVCSTCDHAFTQLSNLKRHERLHTGEKPYACKHCPKTFSNISNLKQHIQVHEAITDRPRYTCEICSKSYYYHSSLRKHVKEHEEEDQKMSYIISSPVTNDSDCEYTFEPELVKKAKFEFDSDGVKKDIEIDLEANLEQMTTLPLELQEILANSLMMKDLQNVLVESTTNEMSPIETYNIIHKSINAKLKEYLEGTVENNFDSTQSEIKYPEGLPLGAHPSEFFFSNVPDIAYDINNNTQNGFFYYNKFDDLLLTNTLNHPYNSMYMNKGIFYNSANIINYEKLGYDMTSSEASL